MVDLAAHEAALFRRHQALAAQLLELIPATIRDHTYAMNRAAIIAAYDALAEVAAELVPIQLELRQRAAERMAEHRAAVAQQAAEERRRKREAEQALQAHRDLEWQRSPLRIG